MIVRTLYVDHNVLAREENWPDLESLIRSKVDIGLAVSEWNLVEVSSGADRAQALKRAEYIDALKPLWVMERLVIQQHEVKQFVYRDVFDATTNRLEVFSRSLSVILSYQMGRDTPLAYTAKRWVEDNFGHLGPIHAQKPTAVHALKTLQGADKKRKRKLEEQIFREWVSGRLPNFDPQGKAITKDRQREMLNYCWANRNAFYLSCPAVAVEDRLTEARTRNPKRNPKESDAIDLQHSVPALAYCEFFVSGDGFVRDCARNVAISLKPLRTAVVFESINALAAHLQSTE